MPSFDARLRPAALFVVLTLSLSACNNAPPGGGPSTGTPVSVDVVDTGGNPVNGQAAMQIGSGSWTSIVPTAVGRYEFVVPSGETRYGFVVNCPSGLQASSTKVVGFQATTVEITELLATCPRSFVGSTTIVEGTYNGSAVGANVVAVLSDRDLFSGPPATSSGTYGPLVTTAGPDRTLVVAANNAFGNIVALKAVRNLDLTSATNVNITLGASDFVSGFGTPDFSSTVPAGYSPRVIMSVVFEGDILLTTTVESTSAPTTVFTFPNLAPGDTHVLSSVATDFGPPFQEVSTVAMRDDLTLADLDLPAAFATPPTVVGTALPTVTGVPTLPGEPGSHGYSIIYGWDGIPSHPPYTNLRSDGVIQIFFTSAWFGASNEYTVPDLTSLPGFEGAKPLSGEEAFLILSTVVSSIPMTQLLGLPAFPRTWDAGLNGPYPPPVVENSTTRYQTLIDGFTVP